MELALRQRDTDREWLAGLDQCVARDSDLDIKVLMSEGLGGDKAFDEGISYLPVLWKKYHDRSLADRNGYGGRLWVANIREATRKRLAVSCRETHKGYGDSARSAWNRDSKETERDSWNDDVMMDSITNGGFSGGAEHRAKFDTF
jgi:hypothetical protein